MSVSRPRMLHRLVLPLLASQAGPAAAQSAAWTLWASGLQPGIHPRLAIAPDHSLYYGLLATGGPQGVIYRAADARAPSGQFSALPPIPYVSLTNNIEALTSNAASEPVVGIFHGTAAANLDDPIAFVLDRTSGQWVAANLSAPANLGVFALTRAPNGDVWFGAKWSQVYRSSDGGRHFTAIDESALVQARAPCYYPTLGGAGGDGAIYSIAVDRRGWVYAGTETAGLVCSADNGASWQPVDPYACLAADPAQRNPSSPMEPLVRSGNVGAIGFTLGHDPVWNGVSLFYYNWPSSIGRADLAAHTVAPATGFTPNFIYKGLQVTRIVTTANGTMFLHSGANPSFDPVQPPPPSSQYSLGLFRSDDGLNWSAFNTGIPGNNDGLAEGALAVDGNRVFTATSDGKIWYLDTDDTLFRDGFGG